MRKSYTKHKGFTLIEMVIVIIVLLILISISARVLITQFRLFTAGQELLNADWQGRIALDRMVRDMRNTFNIVKAKENSVEFKIIEDKKTKQLTYKLNNENQLILKESSKDKKLADNIKQLTLDYYNTRGEKISQPITKLKLKDIRYITINANVIGKSEKINFNITTAIYLWNLKN